MILPSKTIVKAPVAVVTTADIAPGAITLEDIADGTLDLGSPKFVDGSLTNAKIKNGTIDLLTKCTYVPMNKAGDTITGDLTIEKIDPILKLKYLEGGTNTPRFRFSNSNETENFDIWMDTAAGKIMTNKAFESQVSLAAPEITTDVISLTTGTGPGIDLGGKNIVAAMNGEFLGDITVGETVDSIDLDIHRHDGTAGHGVGIGTTFGATTGDTASTTSTTPYEPSGHRILVDFNSFNSSVIKGKLLVRICTNTADTTAYARLRNITDGVSYGQVSTTSTSYVVLDSGWFSLPTTGVKEIAYQHWNGGEVSGAATQTYCWNLIIRRW
jgi:hypothetical protein